VEAFNAKLHVDNINLNSPSSHQDWVEVRKCN